MSETMNAIDAATRRCNAAKLAREVLEMVAGEAPGDEAQHFWEVICKVAAPLAGIELVPPLSPQTKMTDDEARAFERLRVPFGIHAGAPVGEVPVDYWLAVTEGKFNNDLKRYLRSSYFQRRQSDD